MLLFAFRYLASSTRVVKAKLNALIVIIKVAKNSPTRIDRQLADEINRKSITHTIETSIRVEGLHNFNANNLLTFFEGVT